MELCPTLEMIVDYFTKSLQGYQVHSYRNSIIGIHEYDIPSYNAPGVALLEEKKI